MGWAKRTTGGVVPVCFQAAGQQSHVGLKESIVTSVLMHMELEVGGKSGFLNRRSSEGRCVEAHGIEDTMWGWGRERSTFL